MPELVRVIPAHSVCADAYRRASPQRTAVTGTGNDLVRTEKPCAPSMNVHSMMSSLALSAAAADGFRANAGVVSPVKATSGTSMTSDTCERAVCGDIKGGGQSGELQAGSALSNHFLA